MKLSAKMSYGATQISGFDKVIALFIAGLPVIALYNFPILNISLATVLLFCFLPHFLLYITAVKKKAGFVVFLFIAFYAYLSTRAEGYGRQIMLYAAAVVALWGMAKGALKESVFREYIEKIAMVNAVLVTIQVAAHYMLGRDVSFVMYSLLQSDYMETYADVVASSVLYRPSAMFMEPAHFSQYCLFAMISALFTRQGAPKIKRAALIAVGIVMTTSGMGILMMAMVIGWYVFLNKDKLGKRFKRIAGWSVAAVIAFIILMQIPFFQSAMMRVFGNLEGYNALEGRTGNWSKALSGMTGSDLWYGYGGEHKYVFYLSGVPDTIYRFGIIGLVLEGLVFLYFMIKRTDNYVMCCSVVFIALFCVANLMGVFTQMFYFAVIMAHANALDYKRVRLRDLAHAESG